MNDLAIRDRLNSGLGVTIQFCKERLGCTRDEAIAMLKGLNAKSGNSGIWKIPGYANRDAVNKPTVNRVTCSADWRA